MAVGILRAPEGLDFTGLISDSSVPIVTPAPAVIIPEVSTVNLNPGTIKISLSSASVWTNAGGKNILHSQDSLESQGNYYFHLFSFNKKKFNFRLFLWVKIFIS